VAAGSITDDGDVARLRGLGPFDAVVCTGALERIPTHGLPQALAALRMLAPTVVLVTRQPDLWERDRLDTLVSGSREFWISTLREAGFEESRRDARRIFAGAADDGIERLVVRRKD